MARGIFVLIVAALSLFVSAPSVAQAPLTAADEAKFQYEKGRRAYDAGRYDEAVEAFARAFELDPAPMLLFNVAQSHWKNGAHERALFFYRRYVAAAPDAENRAQVETRIRELEAQERTRALTPSARRADSESALNLANAESKPEKRAMARSAWFWGALGAVLVGTAAVAVAVAAGRTEPWHCGGACDQPTYRVPAP